MDKYIIAYDLGTGGNKASLYDLNGKCIAENFASYETLYPQSGFHEQRPEDWWQAIVASTRELLEQSKIAPEQIQCCGISGHSLGVVPLDKDQNLLCQATPIWSDSRPTAAQTAPFFEKIDEEKWYSITGNGFPPALYSIFKILWYKDNMPQMFEKISKVIGTKDYINFKLTGVVATDYSYASGSGVYDLQNWCYSDELIEASGIDAEILPEIVASTKVLGTLTEQAALELGLTQNVKVVAGGVDNSCMALGAKAFKEGRCYNSLGSSSWIAISSHSPLIDVDARPYVFAHVVPEMFASATAIFSAGSSFKWVKQQLCSEFAQQADQTGDDVYDLLCQAAQNSPVGAKGLIFNPSLAGGSCLDASPNIRGAFIGLDLGHTKDDVVRATLEGIALGLKVAVNKLGALCEISDEMIAVGGGSQNEHWRQIFADAYKMKIVKTSVDQQAAALGAAALAAVGAGLWGNFDIIDKIHEVHSVTSPACDSMKVYDKMLPIYEKAGAYLSELGDDIAAL